MTIIEDKRRLTTAMLNGSAGPVVIDFPIFEGTGVDLLVKLDGVEQKLNWSVSATITAGFLGAPNTYNNALLTFAVPVTGVVTVEGRRRPRRTSTYTEGRGTPARDLNTDLATMTANLRELFDRVADGEINVQNLIAPLNAFIATANPANAAIAAAAAQAGLAQTAANAASASATTATQAANSAAATAAARAVIDVGQAFVDEAAALAIGLS